MPGDLPGIIYYLQPSGVVLTSLPRRTVSTSNGRTDRPIIKPNIPVGAVKWRLDPDGEWNPLSTMPLRWREYLESRR